MCWFIVDQLFIKGNFKAELDFFAGNLQPGKLYLLLAAILLMPLNWLLEVVKWRQLIKTESPYSKLVKAIMAGITIGFITPGRSGEFIGRVLFLDEKDKARVFFLSSIGGIAQTCVTLMAGVPFVYFWCDDSFLSGLTIGITMAYLFLYFRFDLLNRFISSNAFMERYSLTMSEQDLPNIGVQINVLLASLMRYTVYLLQYVLVLLFFGVGDNLVQLAIYSGVFLLAQTFSPLIPLLDVAFRGGTALFIFAALSSNSIAVLCSVTFIWLLNLVIPSLAGYLFILRKRTVAHVI